MARTSSIPTQENASFVYRCTFETLLNEIERSNSNCTNFKIGGKLLPNDTQVYVTGIAENNEVLFYQNLLMNNYKFDKMAYARLLIALEGSLKSLKEHSEQLSKNFVIMEQRSITPIYHFKNGIMMAEKLGIMPWHHLLFTGEYVIVYVWDTRHVDKILKVNDTIGLTSRMFKDARDNYERLVFDEQDAEFGDNIMATLPASVHPVLHGQAIADELNMYVSDDTEQTEPTE